MNKTKILCGFSWDFEAYTLLMLYFLLFLFSVVLKREKKKKKQKNNPSFNRKYSACFILLYVCYFLFWLWSFFSGKVCIFFALSLFCHRLIYFHAYVCELEEKFVEVRVLQAKAAVCSLQYSRWDHVGSRGSFNDNIYCFSTIAGMWLCCTVFLERIYFG